MNPDKEGKRDWLAMQDPDNPYLNDLLKDLQKAEDKGLIKPAPSCVDLIKTVEDMLLYIYEDAADTSTYRLRKKEGKTYKIVFYGEQIRDNHVTIIEDVRCKLSDVEYLREIRLVDTGISESGKKRIRSVFPSIDLTEYSEKDNENWIYAYYDGQDEDDKSWETLMMDEGPFGDASISPN